MDWGHIYRIANLAAVLLALLIFAPIAWGQREAMDSAGSPSATGSGKVATESAGLPTPSPIIVGERPRTGIDLTVSPVFINLVSDPGEEVVSEFSVRNNGNETEYLKVEVKKFDTRGETGEVVITDLEEGDPFPGWVNIEPVEFELGVNEEKVVKFTVEVPAEAALGYYYALVVTRIEEGELEGGGAVVAGAPAIPLLLEVRSPDAKRELQLLDFSTDRFFYEYLPVEFNIKLENTGNIHVIPGGNIFIDSQWEKEVGVLFANVGRGNVLPQSVREFNVLWEDGFIVRDQEAGELSWDLQKGDKFRIGKYTATLLLIYDSGERDIPLEARVSFWVVPWKILGVMLVVVILAGVGLRSTLRGVFNKIRKK